MKSAFVALALSVTSLSALAMPHDQPVREVYEKGSIQIQVYRSPGLASADVGDPEGRLVDSILICKNGMAIKSLTTVREIQGSIVGLSKTGGVVLTSTSTGLIASLDLGKLKLNSVKVKMNSDESGINGFEINDETFGSCAKKTDRVDL